MKTQKRGFSFFVLILMMAAVSIAVRAEAKPERYVIDSKNAHAFIQFRISHLGFSYVLGRFNRFDGIFIYDPRKPSNSKVKVTIDMSSIDTNNAERDKHLRSKKFFDVKKFPKATFISTDYQRQRKGRAVLRGNLTLHGVTRPVLIRVRELGVGKDPWGGFRRGFEGSTRIVLKDFGITTDLGPTARAAYLFLSIEGIREK
jgi:polyisoprenoid-binding protein YceI